MRIGTHDVGPGHPTFIIAEAGSNHGGDLDAALELVDAAAMAGADAVKFQLWEADRIYPRDTAEWTAASKWQLPIQWLPVLSDRAASRSIEFMCSAFDFASLDAVDPYVNAHKVASIESTWLPYVKAVQAKKKPVLLSTGATTREEIIQILSRLEPTNDVVLLQATVSYPAAIDDVDLRAMASLQAIGDRPVIRANFPMGPDVHARLRASWADVASRPNALVVLDRGLEITSVGAHYLVGYSDHTTDPWTAPCAAVALGACVIEKHIKPDEHGGRLRYENAPPDWPHSIAAWKFAVMVDQIRLTEKALGGTEKRIRDSEREYLKYRRGPLGLRGA